MTERALRALAGGVSSPVRAFGAVGGHPLFLARGEGSHVWDADGNEYVDLVMSWGPLIHGHAHPSIVEAAAISLGSGSTFGAPTEIELLLAERLKSHMPSLDLVRFVSSGTEATMSAIRLARAFTGREAIVKFDGCYHGHVDALLIQAGSGALTHGRPDSAGVPDSVTGMTWGLPFNDCGSFESLMDSRGEYVAAVIVEPIAGNMGVIPPEPGFLQSLRDKTKEFGAVLIFDEVITGFRVGLGGAQAAVGITPDLTCLGKIIGGGFPAAAFGGRREIMELLSPLGPVYQAGTLSGNPVAMAAGLAAITLAERSDYDQLAILAESVDSALNEAAAAAGIPLVVNRFGSMLSGFFSDAPVVDLTSARGSDVSRYRDFFHRMLSLGVYLPPSQFETWMLSFVHSRADLDRLVTGFREWAATA